MPALGPGVTKTNKVYFGFQRVRSAQVITSGVGKQLTFSAVITILNVIQSLPDNSVLSPRPKLL